MRSRTKTPPINARGALLLASDQGQEGGDGDSVHLLWHSHGECSAAGGESDGATTGGSRIVGCLKRSQAESSKENSWMVIETQREIRTMKPGPSEKMI